MYENPFVFTHDAQLKFVLDKFVSRCNVSHGWAAIEDIAIDETFISIWGHIVLVLR